METKFTKGEWRIEVTKHGGIDNANVYYPHGFLTSSNVIPVDETRLEGESWIDMRDRTKRQRRENKIESIANMHLIAAAPEMYNLLERLTSHDNCKKDIIHLLGEADNLLAKARGENV